LYKGKEEVREEAKEISERATREMMALGEWVREDGSVFALREALEQIMRRDR
jgi:hypothetical protein